VTHIATPFETEGLEDYWHRREASQAHTLSYNAYGLPVELRANDPRLLKAARLSSRRYSRCAPLPDTLPLTLRMLVDEQLGAPEVPADWAGPRHYQAVGPWLAIDGAPWLLASADLERRTGLALVATTLADQPSRLSRCTCDTLTLNAIMHTGLGLLHASCLSRDGTALLLCAEHNTGKSTTALHLAMNGWGLLADGMTYVRVDGERLGLMGYPVGEAKLRFDMLDHFPQLTAMGQAVRVREDTKMVFDLRQTFPGVVVEEAIWPERVVLCHMTRRGDTRSTAQPVGWEALFPTIWSESTFVEPAEILRSSYDAMVALLTRARCYELSLGTDVSSTLGLVDALCRA